MKKRLPVLPVPRRLAHTLARRPAHALAHLAVLALAVAGGLLASGGAALAGGPFSPRVYVNDTAVTGYEFEQRALLMKALNAPGDPQKEALGKLIDERLQLQAAHDAGITVSDAQIARGIEEFASRADMKGDQFLALIAESGVAADTFRDFVRAGLAWRELVRSRFSDAVEISDAEIDRALALEGTTGGVEVQISEIFLPTNTPKNAEITRQLAPQIAALHSVAAFADAARRFSAGASRDRGGQVEGWLPIGRLPAAIREDILKMSVGQVTRPVEITGAVALFQLRAMRETPPPPRRGVVVDYAQYLIDNGRSEAARARAAQLAAQVDTCDDLYGIARGMAPEVLERTEQPVAALPPALAREIARLDPNEASSALVRPDTGQRVFLMLCSRHASGQVTSRKEMRDRLRQQRLSALADAYLDALRANATILYP